MLGYTDTIPSNEYNPGAAQAAISTGGYANGFSCTLMANSNRDFAVKAAQVIQSQLNEIGISVKVEQLERATWSERLNNGTFEFSVATLNWPDSNNMLTYLYDTQGAFNYDKAYSNPEIDRMLARARESNDTAERERLYRSIAAIGYTDRVIIPLFFPNEIVGANARINGIEIVDNCYYPIAKWTVED
jgi:peptide/nickel transport system substrate-binding protein